MQRSAGRWAIVLLIAAAALSSSVKANALTLVCEAGQWDGVVSSYLAEKHQFENDVNGISLARMVYEIDDDAKKVEVSYGSEKLNAILVNEYIRGPSSYWSILYRHGGVATLDTAFVNGVVFSQQTKASMGRLPIAETFYKVCEVVSE